MGVTVFVFEIEVPIKGVLAGHIVAMVTYCATKCAATCSPMIGRCFDTMILASTESLGKYWKLFPATIKPESPMKLGGSEFYIGIYDIGKNI